MKTSQLFPSVGFAMLLLILTNCNKTKSAPTYEIDKEVITITDTMHTTSTIYNPDKGCHIVGAEMTKMLGDSLGIVMYEFTMKPGDTVGWHEHPYHTIYFLEGGTLALYDVENNKSIAEFPTGLALIGGPEGDAAVNIGTNTVKFITQDLYSLKP
ncbi:cupin domain-containing protein [Formosa sp. S-31]|uniref:cupin domain-containing protein n=1 Tax=Formosa sp. S-31 TaxID=2790949 RepID=UPI003EBC62A5